MNLSDIQIFIKVAVVRSFSGVAKQQGLNRSAVSRSVSRLEKQLGVKLLHRSPHYVGLTEAGLIFYKHSVELDEAVQRATESVCGYEQRIVGDLSIAVPSSIGAALMPGIIQKFHTAFPDMTLNFQFGETKVDLPSHGLDVEIRITEQIPDFVSSSRQIGTTHQVLVASPDYIDRRGLPLHLEDLGNHCCLALSGPARSRIAWRFTQSKHTIEVPVDCGITANTDLALILAACLGQGILYIPELSVSSELVRGRLRIILPDCHDPQPYGIHAIYSQRNPSPMVHKFVDYVEEELPKLPFIDNWAPLIHDTLV